jgi:hypothetical protein
LIQEALEYLAKIQTPKNPVIVKVGEQDYAVKADGTLDGPVRGLAPQWVKPAFQVSTLSGLAQLVKAKVDDFGENVALHVVDHLTVRLVSTRADEFGRRHIYAEAKHVEGALFEFNQFQEAEEFLIAFRRSFLYNDEAIKVQQLCSNLEGGMTINLADDGVSQQLEVKSGTISKAAIKLPAEGISLIPWRTFRDAAPVDSKFLLRLRGVKDGLPLIALYEIDQKWQLDSINSIAKWLKEHIEGIAVIA